LVPCCAGTAFDPTSVPAPAGLGFTRLQKQDVNVAYAATPHYGYKFCVDGFRAQPTLTIANTLISLQARVHFLMKNTR